MTEGIADSYITSDGVRNEKIWLAADFRESLLAEGIRKAGSVNQLGRVLGYRSRVHPGWSVRQLMNGAQPFTMDRLAILCNYIDYPLDEVLRYRVPRRRALNHQSMLPTSQHL
ncbi:MAG: hypothetical protein KIS30_01485 [Thermoplasmata archaeon]|nr:hypothetical protein [Candidatus Sysuiplasma acidicola]MBX8637042.1 hypothetical protein [Candidatus Sysuiplasma acidicola]MBX8645419.1 hypothetical protein [Candidatus Sysuiplasma acidicola]MDH2906028.1 hypothetical protein [Methanomassiliicoccales archaeon]